MDEEKECELDFVIQTLSNALKKKKDIKQALKENEFAEYTIETPYYSGIIKIEKLKEK